MLKHFGAGAFFLLSGRPHLGCAPTPHFCKLIMLNDKLETLKLVYHLNKQPSCLTINSRRRRAARIGGTRGFGPSRRLHLSGGCALVGVPWRGSVSARLAWGDIVSFKMLSNLLKMLSILRRQGTPMRAHLQLPESEAWAPPRQRRESPNFSIRDSSSRGLSLRAAARPVSVNRHMSFMLALAMQSSGRNCHPAPDLVL